MLDLLRTQIALGSFVLTGTDCIIIILRAKLSGAVYCYRSCLCVCNGWAGDVCVFVGLLPR